MYGGRIKAVAHFPRATGFVRLFTDPAGQDRATAFKMSEGNRFYPTQLYFTWVYLSDSLSVCFAAVCHMTIGQLLSPIFIDEQDYSDVVLNLTPGGIKGRRLHDVDVYRAVPYAKRPTRFEMAKIIESFPGAEPFDAQSRGPTCFRFPLPGEELGEMSEDCLTLGTGFEIVVSHCLKRPITIRECVM